MDECPAQIHTNLPFEPRYPLENGMRFLSSSVQPIFSLLCPTSTHDLGQIRPQSRRLHRTIFLRIIRLFEVLIFATFVDFDNGIDSFSSLQFQ